MHRIYNTEAYVLKSLNFGEANKFFFLFTKDFGLIRASAQGIRHLKSKLRYSLQDFCYTKISLVRGREMWRITGAERIVNFCHPRESGDPEESELDSRLRGNDSLIEVSSENFLILSRIFSLLLRLLHGEEKNEKIFELLNSGMLFLKQEKVSKDLLGSFEALMALRILSALGYIGNLGDLNKFVESPYWDSLLLEEMSLLRIKAVEEINKSLKETHL